MRTVAVYGTLKQGFSNHYLLESSRYIGEKRLSGWVMRSMGGFPACHPGNGSITVELYEVDDETLKQLDWLEGYRGEAERNFYNRTVLDCGAFMYTIDQQHIDHLPVVVDGVWKLGGSYAA